MSLRILLSPHHPGPPPPAFCEFESRRQGGGWALTSLQRCGRFLTKHSPSNPYTCHDLGRGQWHSIRCRAGHARSAAPLIITRRRPKNNQATGGWFELPQHIHSPRPPPPGYRLASTGHCTLHCCKRPRVCVAPPHARPPSCASTETSHRSSSALPLQTRLNSPFPTTPTHTPYTTTDRPTKQRQWLDADC